MLVGVLSCLPTASDERQVELVIQGEEAVLPDSVVWVSGQARGHVALSTTAGGLLLELPIERMGPSGMTLTGWKYGIQTSRLQYLPDRDQGARLISREINPSALRALELYDSLHEVDATRYPAPTPVLLSTLFAQGLVRGDSAFARFPASVPQGLSARSIDSLTPHAIAAAGIPVDSLAPRWLLPYGTDSARKILAASVEKGQISSQQFQFLFPNRAPELARALSLTPRLMLTVGSSTLDGAFSDDSGVIIGSIEVFQGDTGCSALFVITPPSQATPAGSPTWSLAGAKIHSLAAPPARYRLQVAVTDARGQTRTASLMFEVDAVPRLLPATPHLSGDTLIVAHEQTDAELAWRIECGHPVTVMIDSTPAASSQGIYSRTFTSLPVGTRRSIIRLTDSAGTNLSDTLWIRRLEPNALPDTTRPTAQRSAGTTSRVVPFDTTEVMTSWTVQDDVRVTLVTIQGVAASVSDPATYSARVRLEEGANKVILVAEDATGNRNVDSVVITRSKDVTRPTLLIAPRPPEVVGGSVETYELHGLVSDNDRIASVLAGDVPMTLVSGREDSGTYLATLDLAPGVNVFTVIAKDRASNATAPQSIAIYRDTSAPVVKSRNQPNGPYPWTRGGTFTAEWRLEDDHRIAEVLINGEVAARSGDAFSRTTPYRPGRNEIILIAKDVVGNTRRDTIHVVTRLFDQNRNDYRIQLMPDGKVWMGQDLVTIPNGPAEIVQGCYQDSCSRYGRFYRWHQAMNLDSIYETSSAYAHLSVPMQGICPTGWHIPDSMEWHELFLAVARKHDLLPPSDSLGIIPLRSSEEWSDRGGYYPGTNLYQEFFIPHTLTGSSLGYYQKRSAYWLPKERENPYTWWAQKIDIHRSVEYWNSPKIYVSFARCVAD